jgi:hypothetical protein
MPKYVIEREIPEAGKLSAQQLQGHFAEVLRSVEEFGTANPMGPKLRD